MKFVAKNRVIVVVVALAVLGLGLWKFGPSVHGQSGQQVQGGAPNGNTDAQYPVVIAGHDSNPTIRTLLTDSSGHLLVSLSGNTGSADPCQSQVKSSAAINITSATTTQLVAGVSAKVITVCDFSVAMIGTVTADTFQLEYGTGGSCTSPTVLTGAISSGVLTAGATFYEHSMTLAPSLAAQGLCAVTTVGVGPSIQGTLSYVQ